LIEQYLLIDATNREQLRAELKRLGFGFTETPLFKIGLNMYSAQQIIKAIETPLTVVKTHIPSLEDAYLEIVGHS